MRRLRHRIVFGKAIRTFRKRAGLTQEGLARRAGLHRSFISGLERGVRECYVGSIVKIAKGLRVQVRDLVRDL
jgi:transcriptional regulator with XRE-family HTH domain